MKSKGSATSRDRAFVMRLFLLDILPCQDFIGRLWISVSGEGIDLHHFPSLSIVKIIVIFLRHGERTVRIAFCVIGHYLLVARILCIAAKHLPYRLENPVRALLILLQKGKIAKLHLVHTAQFSCVNLAFKHSLEAAKDSSGTSSAMSVFSRIGCALKS